MSPPGRAAILYLVPDLYGPPGGIARYCRMVGKALAESGAPVHLLALHDKAAPPELPYASYRACGGSRAAFVRHLIACLLRVRPALVLVGHCHFAPLAASACRITRTPYVVFLYGIEVWEPLSASRRV